MILRAEEIKFSDRVQEKAEFENKFFGENDIVKDR